ncbi:hypothetical protein M8J76_008070 [Diaphorina citri]|nr:hypothetical protein M8J76_008070 [Diaphorina citri]
MDSFRKFAHMKKLKRHNECRRTKSLHPNEHHQDENIKVVVRCRPMNVPERKAHVENVIKIDTTKKCLSIQYSTDRLKPRQPGKARRFTFDAVYGMQATQTEIYENSVRPMVNHMLHGYNVTIFAYGQTGTGKTFTMEGSQMERGIMQNAFRQIFDFKQKEKRHKCIVECCYLELYQGKIRDLLNVSRPTLFDTKAKLTLPCKGLRSVTCQSVEEIENCRKKGYKSRKTASTYFNDYSSRSHAIFIVTLKVLNSKTGKALIHSKLNLVDLAGSECLQKSNATDIRLKECCEINLSLLAVNKVISSTVAGKTYIPYRDSLLTQLLQDSFGGNAKTLMIANIGPAASTYKETLVTLEYANRAKKIKNAPNINFYREDRCHNEEKMREKYKKALEDLAQCKMDYEMAEKRADTLKNMAIKQMKDVAELLVDIGKVNQPNPD